MKLAALLSSSQENWITKTWVISRLIPHRDIFVCVHMHAFPWKKLGREAILSFIVIHSQLYTEKQKPQTYDVATAASWISSSHL